MDEYNASYIKAGFLHDVFDHWVGIEGAEWGETLEATVHLLGVINSYGDRERTEVLIQWIIDDLNNAFAENWWDMFEDYKEYIYAAQDRFQQTADSWRKRAADFKASQAFEDALAMLPEWVKPGDRPPKPDPELATYLRLKEKFEGV